MTESAAALGRAQAKVQLPFFVELDELLGQKDKLAQVIAQRAFEIFEARGKEDGLSLDDWLKAESELICFTMIDIAETADRVKVKMEIPGFQLDDLKISIAPHRLLISGKLEKSSLKKTVAEEIFSEWNCKQLFRDLVLPKEVTNQDAEVSLANGILEVALKKVNS